MRFGVLGPLAVWTDGGEPVSIPGLKVRALLADLLVHGGRPVSVDRLVDDVWGDAAPANANGALQVRVSQLRRALEEAEPGGRDLVVSRAPGYLLQTLPDAVDAVRFGVLAERAQAAGDPRARAALLSEALLLWRGPALADFADEEFARPAIARLEEQRLALLEQQAQARLESGEHTLLAGELGGLVAQHPLREALRATHMRALYRAGRQGDALSSFADLRERLADELGLDPSPELVALHQAILEQDPQLAAGAVPDFAAPRPVTNLPAALTGLIGREEALAEVRSLVPAERLVTLTGSGGVGKTRLAVEVARALVDEFADGGWLVELAAQDATLDLDELVMAVLGMRESAEPGEPRTVADRLSAALRGRRLLLVLDNCEHVVEPVAQFVARQLRAAPGLRILTTSREPLGLAGEVVWEVPALELPDDSGAHVEPEVLARSSAVRLFTARASAAAQGFALDAQNAPAVAVLCRRLDGIPLALELAATRVRALGVQGLVDRLDDRFRVLAAGHRGLPARQRTLTAVIDWSWHLLSEPERVVLRRLAIHRDGCTLEAAEAVCAGDEVAGDEVLDLLARLVDRSLVRMDERAGEGARYRLLESVSAYCADRMRVAGEYERVRRRHADFYLDLAERAEPQLYGHRQRHWLDRLDAESANLRAALDTTISHDAAEPALRLAGALTWYRFLRGRLTEARRALGAALAVPGAASPAVRARAVAWQAGIAVLQGDTDRWTARQQQALQQYEEAGDPLGQARAQWFLAYAAMDLGGLESAEDLVNRSLATFRELGDRWGEAAALSTRAKLAHVRGDLTALADDAGRGAELFTELGDDWGVLQATEWLGGLAEMTGDYEQAGRLNREGLRMARELGLWPEASGRLSWLGWIALQTGDYAHARQCCEEALRLATEQGYQSGEVFARLGLGFASRRDGKLDIAEDQLRHLVELARRREDGTGDSLYLSMVLVELGFLTEQRGDPAAALALHAEAFHIAHEQSGMRDLAFTMVGLAGALAGGGRHDQAARVLGAAAAAQRSTGLPPAPGERDEVDRITGTLRARLGATEFAAAYERGGELQPAQAVALLGEPPYFGP